MAVHGSVSAWDPDQAQAVIDICTALKNTVTDAIAAAADKIKLDFETSDKVFAEDCIAKENVLPYVKQVGELVQTTGIEEAFQAFDTTVKSTAEQIGAAFNTNASNVQEAQAVLAAQVKKAEAEMQS